MLPEPKREKLTGPRRFFRAWRNSATGLRGAWREEEAFRQECLFAAVVIPAGLWLGETGIDKLLLTAPMVLILIIELLNSAIEAVVDRISLENHYLSGLAKDLGAAAVLVGFLLLGLCWILVLW